MIWIYRLLTMSIPGNLDIYKGPSSPWSYGSWISNYLCNQCLSPLMLWVPISIRARCTLLGDKACQWPSSKLQIYICMGDKEHRKYWQEWKLNKVSMVCDISNLQKILDILHQQLSPRSYHWLTPWEISLMEDNPRFLTLSLFFLQTLLTESRGDKQWNLSKLNTE